MDGMGYAGCYCEPDDADEFERDIAHLRALRDFMSTEDYNRIMTRVVDAHYPD